MSEKLSFVDKLSIIFRGPDSVYGEPRSPRKPRHIPKKAMGVAAGVATVGALAGLAIDRWVDQSEPLKYECMENGDIVVHTEVYSAKADLRLVSIAFVNSDKSDGSVFPSQNKEWQASNEDSEKYNELFPENPGAIEDLPYRVPFIVKKAWLKDEIQSIEAIRGNLSMEDVKKGKGKVLAQLDLDESTCS